MNCNLVNCCSTENDCSIPQGSTCVQNQPNVVASLLGDQKFDERRRGWDRESLKNEIGCSVDDVSPKKKDGEVDRITMNHKEYICVGIPGFF